MLRVIPSSSRDPESFYMNFWELFKANLKIIYRYPAGFFWIIAMPLCLYTVVSLVPVGQIFPLGGKSYADFLLPGIIALTIMQNGIYAVSYWLIDLRSQGVIKRFQVTPISPWSLLMSVCAARTLIALFQVLVLTAVGAGLFHATFTWNILSILLLTVLGSSIFLVIGLIISTYANTYDSAAPLTAGIGLAMTFLSETFYPLETFPRIIQMLSKLLPLTYFAHGLRHAYLSEIPFGGITRDLIVLGAWLVVLVPFAAWRLSREE